MMERDSTKKYALEFRLSGPASYLVVPLVMLLASTVAIGLCFFIVVFLELDTGQVDRWIVILSAPWFAGLYFVSHKSRDRIEQGVTVNLGDNRGVERIERALMAFLSATVAAYLVGLNGIFEFLKRFIKN